MMITTGKLRDGKNFYVRSLTRNDLPAIIELQEKVKLALTASSALQPLSEEEFTVILSGQA